MRVNEDESRRWPLFYLYWFVYHHVNPVIHTHTHLLGPFLQTFILRPVKFWQSHSVTVAKRNMDVTKAWQDLYQQGCSFALKDVDSPLKWFQSSSFKSVKDACICFCFFYELGIIQCCTETSGCLGEKTAQFNLVRPNSLFIYSFIFFIPKGNKFWWALSAAERYLWRPGWFSWFMAVTPHML